MAGDDSRGIGVMNTDTWRLLPTRWSGHPLRVAGVAGGLLLLAVWVGYSWWSGPRLPAYLLESRPLVQKVVATGRVISTSRIQVGAEITGTVLERRVDEGDVIHAGDVLIVLGANDLVARVREAEAALNQLTTTRRPQAEAALAQLESQVEQARREARRRQALLDKGLISSETKEQADLALTAVEAATREAGLAARSLASGRAEEAVLVERLAAARAVLGRTELRSAVDGIVLTRNVEPGDLVQPGRVLLEIARAGDTELRVAVDEKNLAVLRLGQTAQAVADAYPDTPFNAVLSFISPAVDAQRGTVDIRLRVEPVPDYLRQDMTVSVSVLTGERAQALVLPNDALNSLQGDQAEVLQVRDGIVHPSRVTLGLRGTAMTEIVSGLEAGDWVLATEGPAAGDRVRIEPQGLPVAAAGTATQRETPVRFD